VNPWGLSATGLTVWGLVAHLVADWLLQSDWMAVHKTQRRMRQRRTPGHKLSEEQVAEQKGTYVITRYGSTFEWGPGPWYDRHPAAYVHAGIHGAVLVLVFGWVAAPLALAHLVIDTRTPIEWWSRLMRQAGPRGHYVEAGYQPDDGQVTYVPLYDVGLEVRFWVDQVAHIVCVAIASLAVGALT
jgi:hypothetical protein